MLLVACHHSEDLAWLHEQDEYEYVVYSKARRPGPGEARWRFLPRNVGGKLTMPSTYGLLCKMPGKSRRRNKRRQQAKQEATERK